MSKQNNSPQLSPDDLNLNKPDRFQQFMFLMADRVYRQRQRYCRRASRRGNWYWVWYWQEQQRLQKETEANLFYASQQAAVKAALQKNLNKRSKPSLITLNKQVLHL